jgi:hypothetical protein
MKRFISEAGFRIIQICRGLQIFSEPGKELVYTAN